MTKKNWLLVIFLIALAAVYVIWFTDWFKPQIFHVSHTIRQMHYRRQGVMNTEPALIFGIEPPQEVTEIKVVSLADFEKDPETLPIWHLISASNSPPTRNFVYGQRIRGLRPSIAGSEAGELQTNVVYRIFVKAGRARGQQDFEIGGAPSTNAADGTP